MIPTRTSRQSNRQCILAVDDAATVLLRIADTLGKHYDVVTVNSGARALRYLEKVKPDLILLDIRMAPKNGYETLREIRDMPDRADVPVIMLTAMEDKNSVLEGITLGIQDYILKPFAPDDLLTREQVCTIVARFAAMEKLELIQVKEPNQFKDSLYISSYARSGVTACQISGVVNGYDNGFFYPAENMSRQECAAVIYRIMMAAKTEIPEGVDLVDLTAGAYDELYKNYTDIPFTALVPASAEPGPVSFFDKTVFIGDSISMTLESYCTATGALSKAQFLCAGSMSPTNMLTGQILPEYPKGSGQKPPIQDSVAATGAEVVYIMLGMDNIAYGVDKASSDYVTIINNILTRNPEVQIVVQSVTPMTSDSPRANATLNNDTINAFNQKMQEICQENRWYYLNVSEKFKGEDGGLIPDYCSDKSSMGMHFTYDGAKVWVDYLLSHIPEDLL